ncbi:MAG TPA: fatty acid desaturase [Verrucomicrobiae bacterium]|nr:fatty acid desaturase [Verrucomicrobiae bacterium]
MENLLCGDFKKIFDSENFVLRIRENQPIVLAIFLEKIMMTNDLNSGSPKNPSATATSPVQPAIWKQIVARYQKPSLGAGVWQILNTLIPFVALWYLMYLTHSISWWLTVPLAVLAGGFLVRIFIIFHDCGHGAFFKSQKANHIVGAITGLLTFTPYFHWRWQHAIHHSSAGDLDRRGTGDVWTLTVREYLESSRWKRFSYRLARNPFILFVVAPLFLFLVMQRFHASKAGKKEILSVYWTNLGIAVIAAGLSYFFGIKDYLIIQLIVVAVAGSAGVWLFYVQHQFEGVYWERSEEWDYTTAALQGSSFYKLPKILQWFSGNIGFHHIHHLSPRIPNYNLEKCHNAEPLFQSVKPITLFSSFKSFTFRLWDEQRCKLVGFGHLRALRREQNAAMRE